jgi:hypothetical protein
MKNNEYKSKTVAKRFRAEGRIEGAANESDWLKLPLLMDSSFVMFDVQKKLKSPTASVTTVRSLVRRKFTILHIIRVGFPPVLQASISWCRLV